MMKRCLCLALTLAIGGCGSDENAVGAHSVLDGGGIDSASDVPANDAGSPDGGSGGSAPDASSTGGQAADAGIEDADSGAEDAALDGDASDADIHDAEASDAEVPDADPPDGGGVSPTSIYVVPDTLDALAGDTFFDHPWPSNLRLLPDGTARFTGFPNPRPNELLDLYIQIANGLLHGFSPVASGFLRFSAPLDPASLPSAPLDSIDVQSSIQLIDIDLASPELGQRKPISLYLRAQPGVYWKENTLSFMPAPGYPLRRSTQYALVVTSALAPTTGQAFQPSSDLRQVLDIDPPVGPTQAAKTLLAPAVQEIEMAGIDRSQIVHLAVFTTNDPVLETSLLRNDVLAHFPAPDVVPADWIATDVVPGVLDVYEGVYGPSPDYQEGTVPFQYYGDGGALVFDAMGQPVVQRQFYLRFALAVPRSAACPMPASGYPIVIYSHGTGGNYRSMLGPTREAQALATRCMATIGIDQIFHGKRPGAGVGTPELLFYNFANPVAGRANGPQSTVDLVQEARLFTETHINVPSTISRTGTKILFNGTKLLYFGHSQGSINGTMFLAIDNQARGGVLSGSGALLSYTLLHKTQPTDIPALIKEVALGLTQSESEELNVFHPWVSLVQSLGDTSDTIHYSPLVVREPQPGFAPKSVMMTEGVFSDGSGDSYAPPETIEIQAVAIGLPPQKPVVHSFWELSLGKIGPVWIPPKGLSGNLADGAASGVLAQWIPQTSDGHFIIYYIPKAMAQAGGFEKNLAASPVGRVPPP